MKKNSEDSAACAAPSSQHVHHNNVPRVRVSVRNVTYAPLTRAVVTRGDTEKTSSLMSRIMNQAFPTTTKTIRRRKTILHNISTDIEPHQLTAWMGPSGSGKTSLISLVAGLLPNPKEDLIFHDDDDDDDDDDENDDDEQRINNHNNHNHDNNNRDREKAGVFVNGEAGALPKGLVGVVWQDDLLLSNLTVEETIRFAARLKTPASVSNAGVSRVVEETMAELDLDRVRHSLVGDSRVQKNVGVSGGERKRVAVAVELVSRPSLLLLDEPTSGLDSTTAMNLVTTLRNLAHDRGGGGGGGRSVVMVVHQPRTEIFRACDSLLLLSRGRVVYDGRPDGVREYLEDACGVASLPPQTNIADWIMDTVRRDEADADKQETSGSETRLSRLHRKRRRELSSSSPSSNSDSAVRRETSLPSSEHHRRVDTLAELRSAKKYNASFWTQLRLLTRRAVQQNRGEKLTRASLLFTLSYVIFTSVLYWRTPDDLLSVYQRNSLLFFFLITQGNGVVVSSLTTFHAERALLSRERARRMYGVLPYFLGKTLADMTFTVVYPLLFCALCYFVCELRRTASAFTVFILIMYLTLLTSQSMAVLFSFLIRNLQVSLRLVPTLNIFLMILAGFYVPLSNMNVYLRTASRLSFATYGFAGLLVNEYGGRTIGGCDQYVDNEDEVEEVGGIVVVRGDECPLPGEVVLESLGLVGVEATVWYNVLILVLTQILLRTIGYFILRRSR